MNTDETSPRLSDIIHQSSKEDDDPILEFRNIQTDHLEKTKMGNLAFYKATGQELIALTMVRIEEMRKEKKQVGIQHVLPLDPYRFSRINNSKKFESIVQNTFINLPSSAGMLFMARMLKTPLPEMIPTIQYVMNVIRLAQAKEYTVFIVGGTDKVLEKLFFNLKRSFPRLRIVGRHSGYFGKEGEERVVSALKKTDPHIIILGLGYEKELKWLLNHRDKLGNAVLVNVGGSLDIMAGQRKKAPDAIQLRGFTWLWRALNRPYRWHRLFIITGWYFKVLYWRMFGAKKKD